MLLDEDRQGAEDRSKEKTVGWRYRLFRWKKTRKCYTEKEGSNRILCVTERIGVYVTQDKQGREDRRVVTVLCV